MPERPREAAARRAREFASHPWLWGRYLLRHELLRAEDRFGEHPRHRDWAGLVRVARPALARLLAIPASEIDRYAAELAPLHRGWFPGLAALPCAGAMPQAPLLYVIVRAQRPRTLVETGVSSGYSSRLVLEALRCNARGHLHSIGVDQLGFRTAAPSGSERLEGRHAGWMVPEELRPLWSLHVGRSRDVLPSLWKELVPGELDLFVHDSLHEYATMRFEYEEGWRHLAPEGLLLSHDIHSTRAWTDFLAERRLTGDVELAHDLGAVRKPVTH